MDFRKELAKFGYNKGNSIDVDILIDEILPELIKQREVKKSVLKEVKLEVPKLGTKQFNDMCDQLFGGGTTLNDFSK